MIRKDVRITQEQADEIEDFRKRKGISNWCEAFRFSSKLGIICEGKMNHRINEIHKTIEAIYIKFNLTEDQVDRLRNAVHRRVLSSSMSVLELLDHVLARLKNGQDIEAIIRDVEVQISG